VTSTAFDENELAMKKMNQPGSQFPNQFQGTFSQDAAFAGENLTAAQKKRQKLQNLEEMGVALPNHLLNEGVMTGEIGEIEPSAETMEMEVQTQDYIDRPQTPLFTPVKNGEDASTQINKGDLFDFDEEVEPIINVLTFKTLEESRMEVLEEEEIKGMKGQIQEFEKVRNRELEIVQKLEMQEIRREEEKLRRNIERDVRMKMAKIYQKKLVSCMFAKNYLKNLKDNSILALKNSVLKKPESNQYQNNILPMLKNETEQLYNEEEIVLGNINELLEETYNKNMTEKHNFSKKKEERRRELIYEKKVNDLIRKRDEKKRRKAERQRQKHLKEMEELKEQINLELILKGEFVDDTNEIFNLNGFNLKDIKCVPLVGGHVGQIALLFAFMHQSYPELFPEIELNEEIKLQEGENGNNNINNENIEENKEEENKKTEENEIVEEGKLNLDKFIDTVLDLYFVKSHSFYIFYSNEDLEKIKEKEPELENIEDLFKIETQENYNSITEDLIKETIEKDETLPLIFEAYERTGNKINIKEIMYKILKKLFLEAKTTKEFNPVEKIKFIPKEPDEEINNYNGIVCLNPAIISKEKSAGDLAKEAAKKKNAKNQKPTFDPFWIEKTYICPLGSDKMKIFAINPNYDKVFRYNFLDCLSKCDKILENDKDNLLKFVGNLYDKFIKILKTVLYEKFKMDVLEIEVEDPNAVDPNAQGEGEKK
jgi:hypothetical protein